MATYSEEALVATKDRYEMDMKVLKLVRASGRRISKHLESVNELIGEALTADDPSTSINDLLNRYQTLRTTINEEIKARAAADPKIAARESGDTSTPSLTSLYGSLLNDLNDALLDMASGNMTHANIKKFADGIGEIKAQLSVDNINMSIKDTQEAIDLLRKGDITAVNRILPNLDNRRINSLLVKKRTELSLARAQLRKEMAEAIRIYKLRDLSLRDTIKFQFTSAAKTFINTTRSIVASADMSAVLIQANILTLSSLLSKRGYKGVFDRDNESLSNMQTGAIREFLEIAKTSFKVFLEKGTYEAATQYNELLKSDPVRQRRRDRAGLEMTNPGDINSAEEFYQSNFVDNMKFLWIGRIKRSSEAHMSLYLNFMRASAFDAFAESGARTSAELEAYAEYLNEVTGRKTLKGKSEKAFVTLMQPVLFAPRLYLSRVSSHWTAAKAVGAVVGGGGKSSGMTRSVGAHIVANQVKRAAVLSIINLMMAAIIGGGGIEDDPEKKQFLSFRWGNKQVDLAPGSTGTLSLLYRTAAAATGLKLDVDDKSKTRLYDMTAKDVIADYLFMRPHPFLSASWSAITGRDFFGDRYTEDINTSRLLGLTTFMPIPAQEVIGVLLEDEVDTSDILGIPLATFGGKYIKYDNMQHVDINKAFRNINYLKPSPNGGSPKMPEWIKGDDYLAAKYKKDFKNRLGALLLEYEFLRMTKDLSEYKPEVQEEMIETAKKFVRDQAKLVREGLIQEYEGKYSLKKDAFMSNE
jgi:hypothetical protein